MATQQVPTSYKDPFWSDLAANTEQKLGLPSGLLVSVLTRGERSNADQVSEAGARTPFQIIPATRKAVLDKYGIDAYLNPQTAAEAAGLLLKESLDRNQGNIVLAAAEYHGGTDPKNWGPRTKAYMQRVSQGVRVDEVPITPDKVLRALDAKDKRYGPRSFPDLRIHETMRVKTLEEGGDGTGPRPPAKAPKRTEGQRRDRRDLVR